MTYKDPKVLAEYQRLYKLKNVERFKKYREQKGTYFLEKKRIWATNHPHMGTYYVQKSRLWKSEVKRLINIDIL